MQILSRREMFIVPTSLPCPNVTSLQQHGTMKRYEREDGGRGLATAVCSCLVLLLVEISRYGSVHFIKFALLTGDTHHIHPLYLPSVPLTAQ